jgi:hypothetical protein
VPHPDPYIGHFAVPEHLLSRSPRTRRFPAILDDCRRQGSKNHPRSGTGDDPPGDRTPIVLTGSPGRAPLQGRP